MIKAFRKYKYGLVLSGGAARGFAHLGVIKALEESEISPDILSGTSAGALVTAFYGDGFSPDEILQIFKQKKLFEYFRVIVPRTGLLKVRGLQSILKKNLRSQKIEELRIPAFLCATNMNLGKPEYIHSGNLVDAVLASASIPVLFEAKDIKGVTYIDGGIMDNLPVHPIENKCRKLIGINVNPIRDLKEIKGIVTIAERSFHLAVASEIERKKPIFDIYIEPAELHKYGLLDLKKADEIFKIGYEEAKRILHSDRDKIE